MRYNEKEIVLFDGTEKLNRAQTLTALHNYAMMKMGVPKTPESPVNFYYYTTEKEEQAFLDSITEFFNAMGFEKNECQKYVITHNINDEKRSAIRLFFNENGDVSAMITTGFNNNYGKNATKEAIENYIKEQGLNK